MCYLKRYTDTICCWEIHNLEAVKLFFTINLFKRQAAPHSWSLVSLVNDRILAYPNSLTQDHQCDSQKIYRKKKEGENRKSSLQNFWSTSVGKWRMVLFFWVFIKISKNVECFMNLCVILAQSYANLRSFHFNICSKTSTKNDTLWQIFNISNYFYWKVSIKQEFFKVDLR